MSEHHPVSQPCAGHQSRVKRPRSKPTSAENEDVTPPFEDTWIVKIRWNQADNEEPDVFEMLCSKATMLKRIQTLRQRDDTREVTCDLLTGQLRHDGYSLILQYYY